MADTGGINFKLITMVPGQSDIYYVYPVWDIKNIGEACEREKSAGVYPSVVYYTSVQRFELCCLQPFPRGGRCCVWKDM